MCKERELHFKNSQAVVAAFIDKLRFIMFDHYC